MKLDFLIIGRKRKIYFLTKDVVEGKAPTGPGVFCPANDDSGGQRNYEFTVIHYNYKEKLYSVAVVDGESPRNIEEYIETSGVKPIPKELL